MTASDDDSLIGQGFLHYLVMKKLAEGGFGEVYQAHDSKFSEDRALKLLKRQLERDHHRRFQEEGKALALSKHPNLVRIFDYGVHAGQSYIVMELLQGETLKARLAGGAMPDSLTVEVSLAIVSAIQEVHRLGRVHRDLTPSNVFLVRSSSGGGDVVKVMDLGIAKNPQEQLTKTGEILGTVPYMSPEQADPEVGHGVGPASDVYQICLLMFEMLAGEQFFAATKLEKLRQLQMDDSGPHWDLGRRLKGKPRAIRALLSKGLSRTPADRPTMAQLKTTLEKERRTKRRSSSIPAIERPNGPAAPVPSRWRTTTLFMAIAVAAGGIGAVLSRLPEKHKDPAAALLPAAALKEALISEARELLLRGATALRQLPGGTFWMGRTDAEIKRQLRGRPTSYRALLEPKLRRQERRQVYQPPVRVEETEVSLQQFANFLTTLPDLREVDEQNGEIRGRYIEDGAGRKYFDNKVVKNSECALAKNAKGAWIAAPECALKPADKVSQAGAKAYCEALGRHLISAQEWEYAARGQTDRWFPWGKQPPECGWAVFDEQKFDAETLRILGADAECAIARPSSQSVRENTQDKTPDGIKYLFGNVSEMTSTESPFIDPAKPNAKRIEIRGSGFLGQRELGFTSFRGSMGIDELRIATGWRCAD